MILLGLLITFCNENSFRSLTANVRVGSNGGVSSGANIGVLDNTFEVNMELYYIMEQRKLMGLM